LTAFVRAGEVAKGLPVSVFSKLISKFKVPDSRQALLLGTTAF
jgi:hypothetical protein